MYANMEFVYFICIHHVRMYCFHLSVYSFIDSSCLFWNGLGEASLDFQWNCVCPFLFTIDLLPRVMICQKIETAVKCYSFRFTVTYFILISLLTDYWFEQWCEK